MKRTDEEEFHGYVSARMGRWRRTAYLLCQDWHAADDLVSVTVTKVFRNWRKVRGADNRDAYVQRMLTRTWLDEQKRASRRESSQAEPPDAAWSAPDRVVDRESLIQLLAAIGPRQRAVLVLRFYLDLSVEETAEILQVTVGTVKSQSARGLETLRAAAVSFRN